MIGIRQVDQQGMMYVLPLESKGPFEGVTIKIAPYVVVSQDHPSFTLVIPLFDQYKGEEEEEEVEVVEVKIKLVRLKR